MQQTQALRWDLASGVLPPELAANLGESEKLFFEQYDRNLTAYMRHFPDLDLTMVSSSLDKLICNARRIGGVPAAPGLGLACARGAGPAPDHDCRGRANPHRASALCFCGAKG